MFYNEKKWEYNIILILKECFYVVYQKMLYFFNADNPTQSTSWVTSGNAISVTIPVTGVYMVMVRAYWTGDRGTADLYYNNALYQSGIIVAGTYYAVNLTKSGALNYFTANPGAASQNTDTYIFLSTFRNSVPIMAYNDDYQGSGDFNWAWLSRKLFNFAGWPNPFNRAYIFGSAYASWADGNCDYYFCNSNSDIIGPYFPNLKADDAIKSANSTPYGTTPYYNCISWSGGVTAEWIWPPTDNRWKSSLGSLDAFDKFYKNTPVRYTGAINYPTRVSPSTAGVEVDLWATGSNPNYSYTHGSAIKPANNQMHGYDWESKPGSNTRTFHPRNALNNVNGYGAVVWSYKRAGALASASTMQASGAPTMETNNNFASSPKMQAMGINRPLSFDSSIALGLTMMRNVSFTDVEKSKNSALIALIPNIIKNQFALKYAAWQKTWDDPRIAILSNPQEYAKSAAYNSLKDFCLKQGTVIGPLLFTKAQEEPPFIQVLLEDVMQISTSPEMQAVESEFSGNQYTADGTFIYTTNRDRRVSLCKKLLKNF
jgi:hypothetical protein